MPRLKLNNSDDVTTEEQLARQREIEAEVMERNKRQAEEIAKYTRATKSKSRLIAALFTLFIVSLIASNIYLLFFNKKDLDMTSIFTTVFNSDLSKPLFKESSVEGYLKGNIDELLEGYISISDSNIESYEIDKNSIYIVRIDTKDVGNADVYFSLDLVTKEKDSKDENDEVIKGSTSRRSYQFRLPMACDYSTKVLSPLGQIELVMSPVVDNTKIQSSLYLTFDNISELNDSQSASAKNFVETFLRTLYNTNSDIANLSSIGRDVIATEGRTFVSINDFHIYESNNYSGYNAYVDYTLSTDIGVSYRNRTYLLLVYSNTGTWKIDKIK